MPDPVADPTPTPAEAPAEVAPVVDPVASSVADPVAPAADPSAPWYANIPDDWREQVAGDNEGHLNQLKRMNAPDQLFKSYFEGQEVIRTRHENSGIPGADATPEELALYRANNGIPESPDAYEISLSEGLVLSEEDKHDLAPVFDILHSNNLNSEVASELVDTYMGIQEAQQQRRLDQDNLDTVDAQRHLQSHWGGDFETNRNMLLGMLKEQLPQEALEGFMGARMADGTAIFNDVGVMSAFANMARLINPAATLVPSGANAMGSLKDSIADMESKMGTDEWFADNAMQARYREALEALEVLETRHAAS